MNEQHWERIALPETEMRANASIQGAGVWRTRSRRARRESPRSRPSRALAPRPAMQSIFDLDIVFSMF